MNSQSIGLFLLTMGALFLPQDKLPFVGNLPGDFHFQGKNFKAFVPLGTALVVSLALSIIFSLLGKR